MSNATITFEESNGQRTIIATDGSVDVERLWDAVNANMGSYNGDGNTTGTVRITDNSSRHRFFRLPCKLTLDNAIWNFESQVSLQIGQPGRIYNQMDLDLNSAISKDDDNVLKGEILLENGSQWIVEKPFSVDADTGAMTSEGYKTIKPVHFIPNVNNKQNNFRTAINVRNGSLFRVRNATYYPNGHVRAQGGTFDFRDVSFISDAGAELPPEFRIDNHATVDIIGMVLEKMPITITPPSGSQTFINFKQIKIVGVEYAIQSFTTNDGAVATLVAPSNDTKDYQSIFNKWEDIDSSDATYDVRCFRNSFNAVYNHINGSDMTIGWSGVRSIANGGAEARTRLRIEFLDSQNNPVSNVRYMCKDFVPPEAQNPYKKQITYDGTSDTNGTGELDILLGHRSLYANTNDAITPSTPYSLHKRTEKGDDKFTFFVASYEYLLDSIQNIPLRGLYTKTATKYLINDPNIVKSEAEIRDLTELNNNSDLYGYAKSYLVENYNLEDKPIVNIVNNVLEAGDLDVVINKDAPEVFKLEGTQLTIRSSKYIGSITTGGVITRSNDEPFVGTFTDKNGEITATSLTLDGLQPGSGVHIYNADRSEKLAEVYDSGEVFTTTIQEDSVDIVVLSLQYEGLTINNVNTTENLTLPIDQAVDINYSTIDDGVSMEFVGADTELNFPDLGEFNVQRHMYSSWKRWRVQGDNAIYPPAFDTTGGDQVSDTEALAPYFFLRNDLGWKIKTPAADGRIDVIGDLFARDPTKNMLVQRAGYHAFVFLTVSTRAIALGIIDSGTGGDFTDVLSAIDDTNDKVDDLQESVNLMKAVVDKTLIKVDDTKLLVQQTKDNVAEAQTAINETKTDVGEVQTTLTETKADVGQVQTTLTETKANVADVQSAVDQNQTTTDIILRIVKNTITLVSSLFANRRH